MIEGIVISTQAVVIGFLLLFFYFREKERTAYTKSLQDLVNKLQALLTTERGRIDGVVSKTFTAYLKHIQSLEKLALPKPITTKMVREVMERSGEEVKNEIDKEENDGVPINESNLNSIISAGPKVIFEGDQDAIDVEG